MSWWWYPIEDGDPAEERQFSHKTFLHQVTDILDACVPLYNWSTGASLANLGPYTEGVTDVSAIWKPIQQRIETLVSAFYDYDSIGNGDWFYSSAFKTPWGMADNVYERFKDLARAVSGIPAAHRMNQESVAATGISHTIAHTGDGYYSYTFPASITGFKWNSITVTGLTQSYVFKNPAEDYFTVTSTSEDSEDTTVFFSNDNEGDTVTINYNVDTTGFGWLRRLDDLTYANGQAESGDIIHAVLINQIYACTVILQGFAVLANHSNANVAGTPGAAGTPHAGGGLIDISGTEQCEGDEQEACNDAKGDQEAVWLASAAWTNATNTATAALANITGDECYTWHGDRSKYSYDLTNVPTATDYNVKDFVQATDIVGVDFQPWFIAGGSAENQVWDLSTYNTETASTFTGVIHGGTGTENPVASTGPVCNVVPGDPQSSWGYDAPGWISIKLSIPDPTSSAP